MGKYFYAMSSNDFFTTLVKTQKKSDEDSWDGWILLLWSQIVE